VGASRIGEPIEDFLRDLRDLARNQEASGELVIIGIDDRSLASIDAWPWPRRHYATLIEKLEQSGATSIYFDLDFSSRSNPVDDELLRRAFVRSAIPVTLPVQRVVDPASREEFELLPLPELRREVELASITANHNFRGQVRKLPYRVQVAGGEVPSLSAKIARIAGPAGKVYPIDFSIDPRSIRTISAQDLLTGRVDAGLLRGKKALIGATTSQIGDEFMVPVRGMMPGVYIQALGAETLWKQTPVQLGWLPPALVALLAAVALVRVRDRRVIGAGGMAGIIMLLTVPALLEAEGVSLQIVPALTLLFTVTGTVGWRAFKQFHRSRGSVNHSSGLPNLAVLRQDATGRKLDLIVAKIHNYAEVASALPEAGEEAFVEQVARRLTLSAGGIKIYQGDDGIFAWLTAPDRQAMLGDQLTALHRIFRAPMIVLDRQVDVTLTFGTDLRTEQPLATRLGSAIVAADEALKDGLQWKAYDPSLHEDVSWRISLLSQLDQAIDNGELWLAFQPKLDLCTGRIVGAEALVRWDHPTKGRIDPAEFVLAAEQSGRIGKLTDYVIERAMEAAARLQRRHSDFSIAVNLSARLIEGSGLASTIGELLARHRLSPACLVLEITETAALAGSGADMPVLQALCDLGVRLSIDDYGTGLSTLDYMKRIPASEIKIDKSFIETIDKSRSDRLMVHSTIQLAHSLGQKVVAEGVERAETLSLLNQLGCDLAQGYLIGRPEPLERLEKLLEEQREAA
jgi:EAL domain-containing protein (putative c-di-GMP-specific phosphodiesterase class I)/CHASE2 domain-containing sensor protein